MIAGTSTGAIIAGALTIREYENSIYPKYSAEAIVNLYKEKKE